MEIVVRGRNGNQNKVSFVVVLLLIQFWGGEMRAYLYAKGKNAVKRKTIDDAEERGRIAKAKSQNK